ncbi:hypothetical protein DFJ77DRAFT_518735 [Powellomyces hirtus]|nr:hypothetical protein DFJ77DRAFT_518735 [Powellomyces hirtus]
MQTVTFHRLHFNAIAGQCLRPQLFGPAIYEGSSRAPESGNESVDALRTRSRRFSTSMSGTLNGTCKGIISHGRRSPSYAKCKTPRALCSKKIAFRPRCGLFSAELTELELRLGCLWDFIRALARLPRGGLFTMAKNSYWQDGRCGAGGGVMGAGGHPAGGGAGVRKGCASLTILRSCLRMAQITNKEQCVGVCGHEEAYRSAIYSENDAELETPGRTHCIKKFRLGPLRFGCKRCLEVVFGWRRRINCYRRRSSSGAVVVGYQSQPLENPVLVPLVAVIAASHGREAAE